MKPGIPRRTLLRRALRAGTLAASLPGLSGLAPTAALAAAPTATRSGTPTALFVPSIELSAAIEPVWLAITDDTGQEAPDRLTLDAAPFEIGLPTSPDVAGWYALGAIPGQSGDALLVGHVDTAFGPAVFTRLPELSAGAEIVLDLDGVPPVTFILDAVRRHPAHLPAPIDVFHTDGPPRLHLVTCAGSFLRARGGYQDRLILSASLLPPDLDGVSQSP